MKTTREAVAVLEATGSNGSFIANVIQTGTRKPAQTLRTLAGLVEGGHSVSTASFRMPYEVVVVDGVSVPFETVRAGESAVLAHLAAAVEA